MRRQGEEQGRVKGLLSASGSLSCAGLPAGSRHVQRTGAELLRVSPGTAVAAPSEGTGPHYGTDRWGPCSRDTDQQSEGTVWVVGPICSK